MNDDSRQPIPVPDYVPVRWPGTQVLKDGQRITVDGAQGIVRIED